MIFDPFSVADVSENICNIEDVMVNIKIIMNKDLFISGTRENLLLAGW